jgi:hypothetical protein
VNRTFSGPVLHFPLRIYLAAAGIFAAAIMGWLRCGLTISNWHLFTTLGVQPGAWYLAINGLASGLVYTFAGVLTLTSDEKWKKPVLVLLISGLIIYWIDRICFARSIEAQTSLPFSLVFSTGLTLIAVCLLFWDNIRRRTWKRKE